MTTKVAVRESGGGRGEGVSGLPAVGVVWGLMIMRLGGCHNVACVTRSMECFMELKCVETIITCQLTPGPGPGMMV